jgi:hypothetical protein
MSGFTCLSIWLFLYGVYMFINNKQSYYINITMIGLFIIIALYCYIFGIYYHVSCFLIILCIFIEYFIE